MGFTRRSFVTQTQKTFSVDQGLRNYMLGVFGNMSVALIITGIVAFFAGSSPLFHGMLYARTAMGYGLSGLGWLVTLAPLAFVMMFSLKINSMSANAARLMLWIYSGLLGLSLSSIFLAYTQESIAKIFFITASVFGSMCIYGHTTKRDLTSFGSFLMMGLIGMLIASLANIFLRSPAIDFVTSLLSVLIFTGLTAYDVQKISNIYWSMPMSEQRRKASVIGALSLYMDFINLFLAFMRLFGQRKN